MRTSRINLSGKDKVNLFSDLSTMLTAGIPILETIEALESDNRGSMKLVLQELHRSLMNGTPLSVGMEHFPRSFDAVLLNTLRAAEAGGTLEDTLKDIVRTQKKDVAFAETLRMAMIYPAFIGVIFTGIIVLMLTFVIPRIGQVFMGMHVEMPPITRIMIAASQIYTSHWPLISAGFVALLAFCYTIISANRRQFIRLLLSLPGLRRLGLNIDFARLTRSFALLLRAGVSLDEVLLLSKRVVQKPEVERIIDHMQRNINGGKPLAAGLRDLNSALPPIMARSIETAESTGTLEQTMQNLAEYFDDQVTNSLKAASSLIEPVLIVIIGLMVGLLMITIISPIYNMISQVSAGH